MEETKYLLGLKLITEYRPGLLRKLLDHFGSAQKAWQADLSRWPELAERKKSIDLDQELERLKNVGIDIIAFDDKVYPDQLRHIFHPPPVLFTKGDLIEKFSIGVAIVGTRRATLYGRTIAEELATGLSERGVTIISGVARGVDSAAHWGALKGKGGTIGILGCGLDLVYPPENRKLYAELAEKGSLVTEYPLGTYPAAYNFPARNRIISGLAQGVIVVEAPERSGALITADFALEQGREVFVVPGNAKSFANKGSHKLLKAGACLIESVDDVLQELGLDVSVPGPKMSSPEIEDLSVEEQVILETLTGESCSIDQIIRESNLDAAKVTSLLTLLELKGYLKQEGGNKYLRVK